MFIIAVLALTASMASVVWSAVQQRASEVELAFAGQQFSQAIETYRQRPVPGAPVGYPKQLADLLRDARTIQIERHLRRLYVDPMTGHADWALVTTADGAIVGVHSRSMRAPIEGSLLAERLGFTEAKSYRDWRFIAPSAQAVAPPDASAPAASAVAEAKVGS